MSDPYRSSGGPECPRCRNALTRETDDELVCSEGCGTWLSNKLIETMVPIAIVALSSGNPFRATPLPTTKCLVCRKPLNDLYKGTVDVLTIGQCLEHGVWLERADRAAFTAMFAPEIRARELAEQRIAEVVETEAVDPNIAKLFLRVEALEAQVTDLKAELGQLKSRIRFV